MLIIVRIIIDSIIVIKLRDYYASGLLLAYQRGLYDEDSSGLQCSSLCYLRLLRGMCDSVRVIRYILTRPGRFALRAQSKAGVEDETETDWEGRLEKDGKGV